MGLQPAGIYWILVAFLILNQDVTLGQRTSSRSGASSRSLGTNPKQTASTGVDFVCPEEFGYYPHPSDCTQYYVCVFGGALLESCTGGLMYSHELQTCDWPRNVGCEPGGIGIVQESQRTVSPRVPQVTQKFRFSSVPSAAHAHSSGPSGPSAPAIPARVQTIPPPEPLRVAPNPVVTSRGQPRQLDTQADIAKLYAEAHETLPPVDEEESDRQQRVYRGQPSTIGQVQRDRDGLHHSSVNAIPNHGKFGSYAFEAAVQQQQQQQPQQQQQHHQQQQQQQHQQIQQQQPQQYSDDNLQDLDEQYKQIFRKKRDLTTADDNNNKNKNENENENSEKIKREIDDSAIISHLNVNDETSIDLPLTNVETELNDQDGEALDVTTNFDETLEIAESVQRAPRQLNSPPIGSSHWSHHYASSRVAGPKSNFHPSLQVDGNYHSYHNAHNNKNNNNNNNNNQFFKNNAGSNRYFQSQNYKNEYVSANPFSSSYNKNNYQSDYKPFSFPNGYNIRNDEKSKNYSLYAQNYQTTVKTPTQSGFLPFFLPVNSNLNVPSRYYTTKKPDKENLPDNFSYFHFGKDQENAKNVNKQNQFNNPIVQTPPPLKANYVAFSTVGGFYNNQPTQSTLPNGRPVQQYRLPNDPIKVNPNSFRKDVPITFQPAQTTTPTPAFYETNSNSFYPFNLKQDNKVKISNSNNNNNNNIYQVQTTTAKPKIPSGVNNHNYYSDSLFVQNINTNDNKRPPATAYTYQVINNDEKSFNKAVNSQSINVPLPSSTQFQLSDAVNKDQRIITTAASPTYKDYQTKSNSSPSDNYFDLNKFIAGIKEKHNVQVVSDNLGNLKSFGSINNNQHNQNGINQYSSSVLLPQNGTYVTKSTPRPFLSYTTPGKKEESDEYYYDDDEDENGTNDPLKIGKPLPPTISTADKRPSQGYQNLLNIFHSNKIVDDTITNRFPVRGDIEEEDDETESEEDEEEDDDDDDDDDDEYQYKLPVNKPKFMPMSETMAPKPYPEATTPKSYTGASVSPYRHLNLVTDSPKSPVSWKVQPSSVATTSRTPILTTQIPSIIKFPEDIFQSIKTFETTVPRYLNQSTSRPYTIRHRIKPNNDVFSTTPIYTRSSIKTTNRPTATVPSTTPSTTTTRKIYTIRPNRDRGNLKWKQTKTNANRHNNDGFDKNKGHLELDDNLPNRVETSSPSNTYVQSPKTVLSQNNNNKNFYNTTNQDQYDSYYSIYDDDADLYRDIDYGQQYNTNSQKTPIVQSTYRPNIVTSTVAPPQREIQYHQPQQTQQPQQPQQTIYQKPAQNVYQAEYDEIEDENTYHEPARTPQRGDRNELNLITERPKISVTSTLRSYTPNYQTHQYKAITPTPNYINLVSISSPAPTKSTTTTTTTTTTMSTTKATTTRHQLPSVVPARSAQLEGIGNKMSKQNIALTLSTRAPDTQSHFINNNNHNKNTFDTININNNNNYKYNNNNKHNPQLSSITTTTQEPIIEFVEITPHPINPIKQYQATINDHYHYNVRPTEKPKRDYPSITDSPSTLSPTVILTSPISTTDNLQKQNQLTETEQLTKNTRQNPIASPPNNQIITLTAGFNAVNNNPIINVQPQQHQAKPIDNITPLQRNKILSFIVSDIQPESFKLPSTEKGVQADNVPIGGIHLSRDQLEGNQNIRFSLVSGLSASALTVQSTQSHNSSSLSKQEKLPIIPPTTTTSTTTVAPTTSTTIQPAQIIPQRTNRIHLTSDQLSSQKTIRLSLSASPGRSQSTSPILSDDNVETEVEFVPIRYQSRGKVQNVPLRPESEIQNTPRFESRGKVEVVPLYNRKPDSSKRELYFANSQVDYEPTTYAPPISWKYNVPKETPLSPPINSNSVTEGTNDSEESDSFLNYRRRPYVDLKSKVTKEQEVTTTTTAAPIYRTTARYQYTTRDQIISTYRPSTLEPFTTRNNLFKESLNKTLDQSRLIISPYKSLESMRHADNTKPTTFKPYLRNEESSKSTTTSTTPPTSFRSYFLITAPSKNIEFTTLATTTTTASTTSTTTTTTEAPTTIPPTTTTERTTTISTTPIPATTTRITWPTRSFIHEDNTPPRNRYRGTPLIQSFTTPNSLNYEEPTTYSPKLRYSSKFTTTDNIQAAYEGKRSNFRTKGTTTTLRSTTNRPNIETHERFNEHKALPLINRVPSLEEETTFIITSSRPTDTTATTKLFSSRYRFTTEKNLKSEEYYVTSTLKQKNDREKFRATVEMPEFNIPTESELKSLRETVSEVEQEIGNLDEVEEDYEEQFTEEMPMHTSPIILDSGTTISEPSSTVTIPTSTRPTTTPPTTTTEQSTTEKETTTKMTTTSTTTTQKPPNTTYNPNMKLPPRASRVNSAIKTTIAAASLPRRPNQPTTASLKCTDNSPNAKCNEIPSRQNNNNNNNNRNRGGSHYTASTEQPSTASINRGTPPARVRPTLKPSQTIVSKAQEFVDIYRFPPSRPDPIYPQPTVDKTAAKCRKDVCLLPDCYCGGKDIPGNLPVEEVPQIVLLTFDDAINDIVYDLYENVLLNGKRKNPNGCPITATFYVSHEWTDYGQVQTLYSEGHEMASHTISHSFGEQFSQKKWTREVAGQREILAAYGGVKLDDVRGMRAPFLSIGGNKMFKMLYDSNFTYDSSMPVYENRPPSWPYTLDYKIFHDCMIPPCPTKSYPGVWQVPMVMWQDLNGGRCSMGDACSNPPEADGVVKMLMKNFDRHYETNRAPFGLYYHAAWFTQPHHKEGFIRFLDHINSMKDVWLVTNWQALQWVRDPTPISRMNSFQPFQCDYTDRPKRCNSSKVCNLWHKSGVRYMRTCQPCPEFYPWTGKTGIRSSRIDNDVEE